MTVCKVSYSALADRNRSVSLVMDPVALFVSPPVNWADGDRLRRQTDCVSIQPAVRAASHPKCLKWCCSRFFFSCFSDSPRCFRICQTVHSRRRATEHLAGRLLQHLQSKSQENVAKGQEAEISWMIFTCKKEKKRWRLSSETCLRINIYDLSSHFNSRVSVEGRDWSE